jgi:hypothetical protein
MKLLGDMYEPPAVCNRLLEPALEKAPSGGVLRRGMQDLLPELGNCDAPDHSEPFGSLGI